MTETRPTWEEMTRAGIDVDDRLLAEAAELFGTRTKVATVNAAVLDAIRRRKRQSFLDWLAAGGLPDLTDPGGEASRAARRIGTSSTSLPLLVIGSRAFKP